MEYELIEIFLNIINLEDYSSRENMNMTYRFFKKILNLKKCLYNQLSLKGSGPFMQLTLNKLLDINIKEINENIDVFSMLKLG